LLHVYCKEYQLYEYADLFYKISDQPMNIYENGNQITNIWICIYISF